MFLLLILLNNYGFYTFRNKNKIKMKNLLAAFLFLASMNNHLHDHKKKKTTKHLMLHLTCPVYHQSGDSGLSGSFHLCC